jgi:hypothetical protein
LPRPTTKRGLIKAANEQFEKMCGLVNSIPKGEQNATFNFGGDYGKEAHWARDKNLRDVLVHLYEWHQLLLNWVNSNQNGDAKPFLPAPYSWKTYGDMNVEFWKKHQNTPCDDARKMLLDSHGKVMVLIDGFSDEELFEKKHFSWTGTSNLGGYCISATSAHYDWAMKKIKAHIKTR